MPDPDDGAVDDLPLARPVVALHPWSSRESVVPSKSETQPSSSLAVDGQIPADTSNNVPNVTSFPSRFMDGQPSTLIRSTNRKESASLSKGTNASLEVCGNDLPQPGGQRSLDGLDRSVLGRRSLRVSNRNGRRAHPAISSASDLDRSSRTEYIELSEIWAL